MAFILSNWQAAAWLASLSPDGSSWLALHTADPTPAGDPSTELYGGGYVRQKILFPAGATKAVASLNGCTFPNLTAATLTHLAVWTSRVAGNLRFPIVLPTPIEIAASQQFLIAPGDIALQL